MENNDVKKFVEKSYEEIRNIIRDICSSGDEKEQEERKEGWLECIDHHDVDRISDPIYSIKGIIDSIDRYPVDISSLRDKAFEAKALEWLDIICPE